jgi:hypothetical protein
MDEQEFDFRTVLAYTLMVVLSFLLGFMLFGG